MNIRGSLTTILLLLATRVYGETVEGLENKTETVTHTETVEYGPITVVLDSLAQIAVDVSDGSSTQLKRKLERTALDITGDFELLTTVALQQLSDAIYDTNQLLTENPSCNENWNLDAFNANVSDQLSACSLSLRELVDAFRKDGQEIVENVQDLVQQIVKLPSACELMEETAVDLSFAVGTNCFMHGITEINKNMSLAMHEASLLLVRTRQASQQQVEQAQECSSQVVTQLTDFLENERALCL